MSRAKPKGDLTEIGCTPAILALVLALNERGDGQWTMADMSLLGQAFGQTGAMELIDIHARFGVRFVPLNMEGDPV